MQRYMSGFWIRYETKAGPMTLHLLLTWKARCLWGDSDLFDTLNVQFALFREYRVRKDPKLFAKHLNFKTKKFFWELWQINYFFLFLQLHYPDFTTRKYWSKTKLLPLLTSQFSTYFLISNMLSIKSGLFCCYLILSFIVKKIKLINNKLNNLIMLSLLAQTWTRGARATWTMVRPWRWRWAGTGGPASGPRVSPSYTGPCNPAPPHT